MSGFTPANRRDVPRGFSLLEVTLVLAVTLVILGLSVPIVGTSLRSYRMMNDARSVASQLSLARSRAASNFTQAAIHLEVTNRSYQVQLWNKTTNSFDIAEGGTQYLSSGMTFSFGSIGIPAGTQTTIQQSPQIIFNSRGTPVDDTGAVTGNYAIYLGNEAGESSAISVSASGKVSVWRWSGSAWQAR